MTLFGNKQQAVDWAGIVTWVIVSGITLYFVRAAAGRYEGMVGAILALQLVYLAGMLVAGSGGVIPGGPLMRRLAFGAQLAAALALGWYVQMDFLPIYTIVWLAMAPHFFSVRNCYLILITLMLVWYAIQAWGWQDDDAVFMVLLFGTFHFFAMLSSIETCRAERAREEAQALNQELIATQHLLAEASKQSERTRIARDLHDLLGHHLTALTINLQVASHLADDEAKDRIEQCHALSKLLLSDVREAVTTMREQSALDFARALRLTVENIPRLKIHIEIDDGLKIDDVNIAESLLRVVQEAVTNTLRHSTATESRIRVWREHGRISMQIRDNGDSGVPLDWGNGLNGMRERIERIRGEFTVARVQRAVEINIHIPVPA